MCKEETEFKRNCPQCNKIIFVSEKRGFRRVIINASWCRNCRSQDEENRKMISEAVLAAWADPDNTLNSEEYKEKMKKILNEGLLNEENRKKSSDRMKSAWQDPNSNLRIAIDSEEYHAKLSEASKLKWLDPNSKLNSPEYKEAALQRLLQGAYKCGNGTSKGEKRLYEFIKHLGFIHNDFTIKIDKFYPDIIHLDKKIIIEFNGDLFHANPNLEKYKDDNIFLKRVKGGKTAGEIRAYDAARKKVLEEYGYIVYIVWENDFKKKYKRKIILEDITKLIS